VKKQPGPISIKNALFELYYLHIKTANLKDTPGGGYHPPAEIGDK
jgi:hypothetical protein